MHDQSRPTPQLLFRRLTVHDGAAFQKLRLQALATDPAAFLATLEQESGKTTAEFERELEYALGLGFLGYFGVFIASDPAPEVAAAPTPDLVGYCQISQSFLPKQNHVAFLYNLYLAPAARGQGAATALLNYVFAAAKTNGVERVYCSCNAGNSKALEFYLSQGFVECGRKPESLKWQGVYDDEVELSKKL